MTTRIIKRSKDIIVIEGLESCIEGEPYGDCFLMALSRKTDLAYWLESIIQGLTALSNGRVEDSDAFQVQQFRYAGVEIPEWRFTVCGATVIPQWDTIALEIRKEYVRGM